MQTHPLEIHNVQRGWDMLNFSEGWICITSEGWVCIISGPVTDGGPRPRGLRDPGPRPPAFTPGFNPWPPSVAILAQDTALD